MGHAMSGRHFGRPRSGWLGRRASVLTINSLSGFKSANVIGTADAQASTVSSSVVHSRPPPKWAPAQRPHVQEHCGQASAPSTMWGRLGSSKPTNAVRYPPTCRNSETGLTPAPRPGRPRCMPLRCASVRMGLTLLKDLELPNACRSW